MAILDPKIKKAFAHPQRIKIFKLLESGPARPPEIAWAVGDGLTSVSYHLGILRNSGVIRPASGGIEGAPTPTCLYEVAPPAVFAADSRPDIPSSVDDYVSASILRSIWDKGLDALKAGALDSPDDTHFTCLSFPLDEKGFHELGMIMERALEDVALVLSESERRAADTPGGNTTTVFIANFKSPETPDKDTDAKGKPGRTE